jgi:peptide/nickel transport system substrate-binding protein
VGVALRLIGDDLPYVPLYRRRLSRATQEKVGGVQWPNEAMELRWVRVK